MWNDVGVDATFRSGQNIVVMVAAKPRATRKVAASDAASRQSLAAKR